tara:strand:- start:207 stop:341 length:135 start_codon:yes stop_codon:yes gene_type:complete
MLLIHERNNLKIIYQISNLNKLFSIKKGSSNEKPLLKIIFQIKR